MQPSCMLACRRNLLLSLCSLQLLTSTLHDLQPSYGSALPVNLWRCHAGSMSGLEDAVDAAVAAQRLPPAECQRAWWQKALQLLQTELEAHAAAFPELHKSFVRDAQASKAPPAGPTSSATLHCGTSTHQSSLLQGLETAWATGLQDNAVAALQTLLRWYQDTQQPQHVMTVDLSRHPDSLPWDCEMDAAEPNPWGDPEHHVSSSVTASQGASQHSECQAVVGKNEDSPVLDLLQAEALSGHNSPAPVR